MHPEVLALIDDCVDQLLRIRDDLRAPRAVEPGQRYNTVLQAIDTAHRFASGAARVIGEPPLLSRSTTTSPDKRISTFMDAMMAEARGSAPLTSPDPGRPEPSGAVPIGSVRPTTSSSTHPPVTAGRSARADARRSALNAADDAVRNNGRTDADEPAQLAG